MPTVKSSSGDLHYSRSKATGEAADRTPLLLIPGAGETAMHWPPELRYERSRPVYALDLPGHGRSDGEGCTSIEEYCEVVHSFVTKMELSNLVLAGHSMGGAIALRYMDRYPEQLEAAILVSSGAEFRLDESLLENLRTNIKQATTLIVEWSYASADESMRGRALRILRQVDPALLNADFQTCDRFDMTGVLSELRTPTLILCGTADRMTPPSFSRYLQEHLPNSRLRWIEDAGHMVQLEKADIITEEILAFIHDL